MCVMWMSEVCGACVLCVLCGMWCVCVVFTVCDVCGVYCACGVYCIYGVCVCVCMIRVCVCVCTRNGICGCVQSRPKSYLSMTFCLSVIGQLVCTVRTNGVNPNSMR